MLDMGITKIKSAKRSSIVSTMLLLFYNRKGGWFLWRPEKLWEHLTDLAAFPVKLPQLYVAIYLSLSIVLYIFHNRSLFIEGDVTG